MRGDFAQLPSINFANFSTNKSLKDGLERFGDEWKARKSVEEMRLAYVAFTRAKQGLFCSTSHFRNGENAVAPSRLYQLCAQYLPSIKGGTVLSDTQIPEGKNPLKENPITGNWPDTDSKYEKRAIAIRESAKLVLAAEPFSDQQILELSKESEIISDLSSLINELRNKSEVTKVLLPARLSVSTLLHLKQDPQQLALKLRRPMPNHIDKFARRGTEFHLWLEDYFKHTSLISLDEVFNIGMASHSDDAPMQELQKAWLASEWANQIPIGVEVGFETIVADTVIRGRIDAVYEKSPGEFEVVGSSL